MLGVGRQRVQQLVSRHDFPAPEITLAMGKVWRRADVEMWARAHGRVTADTGENPDEGDSADDGCGELRNERD